LNIDHQYLSLYGVDGVYGKNHKAYAKKDKAEIHQINVVFLPISWEKGFQDSGIQGSECLFSKFWKCFNCLINLQFGDDSLMLIEN